MKQTNGNATRVQKVIMSDANKWLIKDKEEVMEVVDEDTVMLNNVGDDETDHGGDIDDPANSSTTTVIDNGQEVEVEIEGEEEEKRVEEKKEEEKKQQQSVIHKENSSNEDNNCGRASASSASANDGGLPLATLQLCRSLEQHQTAAVSEETPSAVAGNEVEDTQSNGLLGTAARTPPFTMPSPSAKPRTPGILRLDTSGKKSRRSSGISSTVEFRNDPEMLGEVRKR